MIWLRVVINCKRACSIRSCKYTRSLESWQILRFNKFHNKSSSRMQEEAGRGQIQMCKS